MTDSIRYKPTVRYALVGGGRVLASLAAAMALQGKRITLFAGARHADEVVDNRGRTLRAIASDLGLELRSPDDINSDTGFLQIADTGGIALGFGETWSFAGSTVARFAGRLLDVMGIPLPQYRGGAHYTWMILASHRRSAIHLQLITERMRQGVFDDGLLVKSREFDFPATARIPEDYFAHAEVTELDFLLEFVREVDSGAQFSLRAVDETCSLYMPRLHTRSQGWVDWSWDAEAVVRFVSAFDRPYAGASSRIGLDRVFLRGASLETEESDFHPFQAGLVYRQLPQGIWIAARKGAVLLRECLTEDGRNLAVTDGLVGTRLYTPVTDLETARTFRADYDANGLVQTSRVTYA
jgi:hypothetical protein